MSLTLLRGRVPVGNLCQISTSCRSLGLRTPAGFPVRFKHAAVATPTGSEFYQKLYASSIRDPERFWGTLAKSTLKWNKEFEQVRDIDLTRGNISWFQGGYLNVAENCIDRHLATRGDQTAIIWETDNAADSKKITYRELHSEVCRLANALKRDGVRKGDTVTIYMPVSPHAVYAMLACARIGAVHSVVFAGFSAEALRSRIIDAKSTHIITTDQGLRGGKPIELKQIVDKAIAECPGVRRVFVAERTGASVPMEPGRDVSLNAAMAAERPYCPPESMHAEDPLFLLYTSGSTGTPKGMMHTTGGYLLYGAVSHKYVFDHRDGDVFGCMADIGWITGHTYVVYAPLCNGGTTVLFESTPNYPHPGRYWETVQKHRITQFYTAPTALRLLQTFSDEHVNKFDLSSIRVLGSVGEPINPEAWHWYHTIVGKKRCSIVDTWWQTETGGIMMTPLPGDTDAKPGAAMRPMFGVEPVLLDDKGKEIHGNDVSGILCLKSVTPGMARTISGDHARYIDSMYKPFPGYYFTGDGAHRDKDGAMFITGRVDDVINVSGHRLGTAEVEGSLEEHHSIAEAAVVGYPHAIKGQGIYAYVVLKDGHSTNEKLVAELRTLVRKDIGPFAAPDVIQFTSGLPKTRSGKIMRRILRKIASSDYADLGDTSTLNDPAVVEQLVEGRKTQPK
eukprot:Opistho-2@64911